MNDPATAEAAAERAFAQLLTALESGTNFRLEAGAGAGKTTALRRALQTILKDRTRYLPRPDQQIACMTFTNVAREEILKETDAHPAVFVDTIHGFLWAMIKPFQKDMREIILATDDWRKNLEDTTLLDGFTVEYELGFRTKTDRSITLHHNDVPNMAVELFAKPKFRQLIADRYPIIFIDEYQDTNDQLVQAMLGDPTQPSRSPVFGFFGDHWQRIYVDSAGTIEHSSVQTIPVNANFRSDATIVTFLNRLRPELVQAPAAGAAAGTVTVYYTNAWSGQRGKGPAKGQISPQAAQATLTWALAHAQQARWNRPSQETKTLMLSNAAIANELGYSTIAAALGDSDRYIRKSDEVIAYLVDVIEPAVDAFTHRRYGALFTALNQARPTLSTNDDKRSWSTFFKSLTDQCERGSIGNVLDLVLEQHLFTVPRPVQELHRNLAAATAQIADAAAQPLDSKLTRLQNLRAAPYSEIRALKTYTDDQTGFSTKHGVKGTEFDNVVAVLSRSWSRYNFGQMLSLHGRREILEGRELASYERSRNLFYVAASRARHNLVLLFTHELDDTALATLTDLAGNENVFSIEYADEVTPTGCVGL
ncbi:DEAD/DEAH box-containing ATP-dependent helicase [Glycomyces tarimensis]